MTDIVCPLCGKTNPPDVEECQYCQAPLKPGGFLAPAEGDSQKTGLPPASENIRASKEQLTGSRPASGLEQSIPDWLKETEASFMEGIETPSEQPDADKPPEKVKAPADNPPGATKKPAIDEDWLASLLVEAGAVESPPAETHGKAHEVEEPVSSSDEPQSEMLEDQEEKPALPASEKPDWLTTLEASSKIKLGAGIFPSEAEQNQPLPVEVPEEKPPVQEEPPDWLTKAATEPPAERPKEAEAPIAPAELPGWLEAIRPSEVVSPTGPVEDVSGADIVTAGPLMGLKGVISPHPSAIRAQKPPTYSIKLKVTEEQQARLRMMEELLADEGKSRPLPARPIITSRHIFRLVVAIVLILPIAWMIIGSKRNTSIPQPANVPGVIEFAQHIQVLPANSPVLIAFDYEAGFSGELDTAITNLITQLIDRTAYITLASTNPSGPALAENILETARSTSPGSNTKYSNYANLGYIPGGTMGLLGFASSPKNILPYSLDGHNVWAGAPLNNISTIKDFSAVIVITGDPDTARIWIEQVGRQLSSAGTPLLFITSAQAEPLVRPYFQSIPSQVQGLLSGLTGGVAYALEVGNNPQNGVWDAYSAGVTVSILIILVGSVAGVVLKMLATSQKKEF